MKKILCYLSVCLFSVTLNAQSLKILVSTPKDIIKVKWESTKNAESMSMYNNDYAPYLMYLQHGGGDYYRIKPGRNILFTQSKSDDKNPFKQGGTYITYRGYFPKNIDTNFVYALPVKPEKEIEWMIDEREKIYTILFKTDYKDTVYASRNGIVCKTNSNNGLLLYHKDESFAAYLSLDERFVSPGDVVKVGDPIGLAAFGGISFAVFYLVEKPSETNKIFANRHISPVFRTTDGDVDLEKGKKYTSVLDDFLIVQEMSKSEKKRYYKRK